MLCANSFVHSINTMFMRCFLLYSILALCCFCGCSIGTRRVQDSESVRAIDLTIKESSSLKLSQYFNKVKYVTLELTDNSMVGNVSGIKCYDGRMYVLDSYVAKCLFVFTADGRFVKKIGTQGRGPGEFRFFIRDFCMADEMLYLLVDQNRVLEYDSDGNFKKEYKIPVRNIRSFFYHDDVWCFISSVIPNGTEAKRVHFTDKRFKIKREFFSCDIENVPIYGTRENFENGDSFVSYISQCDTLYRFTDSGDAIPCYSINIPKENVIDNAEIKAIREEFKRKEQVDQFKQRIFVLMNAIFSENLTHMRYLSSGDVFWAMHQNDDTQLCLQSNLVNDVDKCSVLPKLLSYAQDKNAFVGVLDPSELCSEGAVEDESFLKTMNLTAMDNPIIAYYELK